MEEEAIIEIVEPLRRTSIGESLEVEFVNVTFRVLRSGDQEGKARKAVIKEPSWLRELQPSAPSDGYLLEHGEFSASLERDDRVAPGLKVVIEVSGL